MPNRRKRKKIEILQDNPMMSDDKRMFCRFVLGNVPVRSKDLKMGEKQDGICKDIGGGGAGIECKEEIKPKTPLEMWVDLPDGFEPMHLLGKVVWSRVLGPSWRMGIAFERPRLMSLARVMKLETAKNA